MPQARGTQTRIAIGDEDSYGAGQGTPDGVRVYYTSENIRGEEETIQDETLTNDRSRAEPGKGNINVGGALNSNLAAEWIGKILKHALGDVTTTGADPYTHEFTIGDLPAGFWLEKDFGSNITKRYELFKGCRVQSMQCSFPASGFNTVVFNVLGASQALGSSAYDSSVTDQGHTAFTGRHQSTINEGGSAIATVRSLEFTLNNGLDEDTYVVGGDGERRAADEGFATITGTLTALFESDALIDKAVNDTETSIQIVLERGDGLGSAGNEKLDFELQQLKYARTSPAIEGPAGLLVPLSFNGYASGSDLGLKITAYNAVATV